MNKPLEESLDDKFEKYTSTLSDQEKQLMDVAMTRLRDSIGDEGDALFKSMFVARFEEEMNKRKGEVE